MTGRATARLKSLCNGAVAVCVAALFAAPSSAEQRVVLEIRAGAEVLEIPTDRIAEAEAFLDASNLPAVRLRFDDRAGREFATFTERHVGEVLRFSLCGRVLVEPVLRTPIYGGTGVIASSDPDMAAAVADILNRRGGCERMPDR